MKLDVIYNKSCQRMDELPDNSIDMVMTSPPYWGLRDYGEDVKEVWGGDPDCEHEFKTERTPRPNASGGKDNPFAEKLKIKGVENYSEFADYHDRATYSQFCQKCGAWYGQLGLEPTFQLYLDHMMIVCAEIKRVLKKTGSFWLNMGDTYNAGRSGGWPGGKKGISRTEIGPNQSGVNVKQMPAKCLIGIPSRLRNRLIDEQGWTCRNTIIWAKPNSMPSSKKDGLTPSYEFLFHLVKNTKPQYYWNEKTGLMAGGKPKELKKGIDWEWRKCPKCEGIGKIIKRLSEANTAERNKEPYKLNNPHLMRIKGNGKFVSTDKTCSRCKGTGKIKHSFWHSLGYWYDLDAIREPYTELLNRWGGNKIDIPKTTKWKSDDERAKWCMSIRERKSRPNSAGKNPGDVWTIPTQPRPEAHFATFPDKLCLKPILATCPAEICRKCGKARVRITRPSDEYRKLLGTWTEDTDKSKKLRAEIGFQAHSKKIATTAEYQTIGWTDCGCNAGWDSGVLLDPFAGRGTALIMAKKLGRHYVGYELKKKYADMAESELDKIDPLFSLKRRDK